MADSALSKSLLKVAFLLHMILSSWGMESAYNVPTSYLYTNVLFMGTLLWAIANSKGVESIAMAFLVNISVFVLDIISLSVYWPGGARNRVYLGFAIANTILRPFTFLILYRVFGERDTEGTGIYGLFSELVPVNANARVNISADSRPGQHQQSYEPIDSTTKA